MEPFPKCPYGHTYATEEPKPRACLICGDREGEHLFSEALVEAKRKEAAELLERQIEQTGVQPPLSGTAIAEKIYTASIEIKNPVPVTGNG